ncbi:MAG: fasciclin domain-containing protein [Maribacter sp.]
MNVVRKIAIGIIILCFTACKNKTTVSKTEEKSPDYITSVDFDRSVMQILDQDPKCNSFLKLVNAVELFEEIRAMNDIMVFVPTDEAYGPSKYLINELSFPDSLSRLEEIINYHFVKTEFDVENLISTIMLKESPLRLETVHGGFLVFQIQNGELQLLDENGNVAKVSSKSTRGSNGVVYTIDRLLMPRVETDVVSSISQGE